MIAPAPYRSRARVSVALDLVLAKAPLELLALVAAGLVFALVALSAIIAPAPTVIGLGWTLLAWRREVAARPGRALDLRAREPRMRRDYQMRFRLVQRLAADLAVQIGIKTPHIMIDPKPGPSVNMSMYSNGGDPILLITPSLLDPLRSPVLDEAGLRGVLAHELAHARPGKFESTRFFRTVTGQPVVT
jgi:Zn-dependent protease with chaperone function